MEWIVRGSLLLPSTIEVLRLEVLGIVPELPPAQQHHALAVLGQRYPCLGEVQFGSRSASWKRTVELWKLPGDKAWVRVPR